LSMVRMPLAETKSVTQRFSDGNQKRRLCVLTRHERFDLMFECETECPRDGFLSSTSQRLGIATVYGATCPCRYAESAMKNDIHPNYQFVVFEDSGANYRFLTRSTIKTDPAKTIEWADGNTYPLVQLDISNASHPFYTGQMKIIDSAGRVERFNKRYGTRKKTVKKAEPKTATRAPRAKK
jgi:large subunit ribosomal protein L31